MNRSETLLIIDGEEGYRTNLHSLLESLGYRALDADSAAAGLALCAVEAVDLLLLDTHLPDRDVFDLCGELHRLSKLADVPIIFLSRTLDPAQRVRAFRAGVVDFLSKPYQREEVAARIHTHLEIRNQKATLHKGHEDLRRALHDATVMNLKLVEINEKLERSEAIKSHFIANMRNEINNPLSVIMGMASQLIPADPPPESCQRCGRLARLIRDEAFNLDFQLRNIFYAGELEAGELAPGYVRVDIASVIRDVIRSMAHRAEARPVVIRQGGTAHDFPTDAAFLNVILANLLANAIQFSHPGGAIDVEACVAEAMLTVSVKDRGIGIQHSDQATIFDRFHQLDTGLTRAYPGQGLGLAVVKSLVELMGGQVAVESQPGHGSVFTLCLPRPVAFTDLGATAADGNLFLFGEAEEM